MHPSLLRRPAQLVNKAAAKYDQMQLTSFLDAASTGEVDVVQVRCVGCRAVVCCVLCCDVHESVSRM